METDELIERLAQDVRPVRPLHGPWVRAAAWLAISLAYTLVLIALLSPSVVRITGIRASRFWLEQFAAFSTAIAAAGAALVSVIPGRSRRAWVLPIVPLTLWMGTLAWGCVRDWSARGVDGLTPYSDWPCVMAMALGAAAPVVIMALMLRRGAPLAPRATAMLAALAGGGLSSVTACLSRPSPHQTTATVVVWHLGTLLMLVSLAAWTGGRLFEWPVSATYATLRRTQ